MKKKIIIISTFIMICIVSISVWYYLANRESKQFKGVLVKNINIQEVGVNEKNCIY